jgi:hypothetical protein
MKFNKKIIYGVNIINCVARVKSLFTNKPIFRKYDNWCYLKGKKISAYDLVGNVDVIKTRYAKK